MAAYITILRPLNSIMSAIAVWIGSLMAGGPLQPEIPIIFGMLATFLVSGGGMVINDYFDRDIDRINKPKRPIPSGRISSKAAGVYAIILFVAGLFVAINISPIAFSIAAIATALLAVYAARLKGVMFAGNAAISFLVALSFLYGGFIIGDVTLIIPLAVLAFLSNMGREIFKTIDDIMGDKSKGLKTVATRLGVIKAKRLASAFIILAVIYSFFPYVQGMFNEIYLFLVIPADIIFLLAAVVNVKRSSKLTKLAMLVALIAFISGAVTV